MFSVMLSVAGSPGLVQGWRRLGAARRVPRHLRPHLLGTAAAMGYLLLAYLSQRDTSPPILLFIVLLGMEWLLYLLFLQLARKSPALPSKAGIVVWAIIFRLIGLTALPIYEDDYNRFLWDGWVFANYGNPYAEAPIEYRSDPAVGEHMEAILHSVNYPEVKTIYGPVLELGFLIANTISNGSLTALKFIFLIPDLVIIFIFLGRGRVRHLAYYAWCPLVVFETAFNAHPDIVGVCLFFIAYLNLRGKRFATSAACCILSLGSKITGGVLLPFVLLKGGIRSWAAAAAVATVLYLPFVLQGSAAEFSGLKTFARYWEFNSSIFALGKALLGSEPARISAMLIFVTILGAYWIASYAGKYRHPPVDSILGWFIFLAPVINPWYLQWIVPFAAFKFRWWSTVACAAVFLSYLRGSTLPGSALADFAHPSWLRPVEFGLIAVALAVDLRIRYRKRLLTDA